MSGDSASISEITKLIADLENWNSPKIREQAIAKISKLEIVHNSLVEALRRIAKDAPYSELGKSALNAIDSMYVSSKLKKSSILSKTMTTNVEIISDDGNGLEVASSNVYCRCNFCSKDTIMTSSSRRLTDRLSGPGRFYCAFCLRNKFNQRDSRHTLIMSYRGIIGYYYYAFYMMSKNINMTINEIWDYVNLHIKIGTQNPLFAYDPESFLWFIDFNRVGVAARKMPIKDILCTVAEMLMAFALHENVKDIKPHKMYLKYEEAILKFYHQRTRPVNMRILSPTLKLTGASEYSGEKPARDFFTHSTVTSGVERKKIPIDETRNFLPQILNEALGKKY